MKNIYIHTLLLWDINIVLVMNVCSINLLFLQTGEIGSCDLECVGAKQHNDSSQGGKGAG